MADLVDPCTRSRMMASIRGKDTKPELAIRKGLFACGYRYRLHSNKLPGKPDIVLPRYRAVVFVNGCFWHWHDCSHFRMPGTRTAWWKEKLGTNRDRDARNIQQILERKYRVCVIWECAWRGSKADMPQRIERVVSRLAKWINGNRRYLEISGKKG